MGVDVTDAGSFGDPAHHAGDSMPTDRTGGVGEEHPMTADVLAVGVLVGGDVIDQMRVQRDVTVVAELPDGDAEPVAVTDLDHWVRVEGAEFTDSHSGAGQ